MMPDTKATARELLLVYGALPIVYVIVGRLGLILAPSPGYATAVFLPAGLAVAAAFIAGLATLPGTFIGSLMLNLWVAQGIGLELDGAHVAAAAVIAFASALQAATGGLLLRKSIGYPAPLDNPRDLLLFLLLSPVFCLTSATVSTFGMWTLGVLSSADRASNWLTWWVGDTLGVLVGLPVTLVLAGEPRRFWRLRALYVAVPMILWFALFAVFVHVASWGHVEFSRGDDTGYQIERSVVELARRRQNWIVASAGVLSTGLLGALLMLGTGYTYRAQAKEEELKAVLRGTPFMLTRCSRDLRFRFVSESYAAMLGRRPEDIVGKLLVDVIGKQAFGTIIPHIGKVLRGERVEYEINIAYEGIEPRVIRFIYTPDLNEHGHVVGWIASLLNVTDQKQAQERERILLLEIQHRSNNLLAVVQAIAQRSLGGRKSLEERKTAFESRLQALARANRQLTESNWQGVELGEIIRLEMDPFVGRTRVSGVDIALEPKQAQNFSLALHELATNACKYGALSNGLGRVDVSWMIKRNTKGNVLSFRWREQGGPPASEPLQLGFGTTLLKATFPGIALHYLPEGFSCDIELSLEEHAG
jgi:two-component sensor histidine kinase/integral membrane sensor domain MASE1